MHKPLHATVALSALLATSLAANAADMHVKAPPPAPMPPVFTWTGFYIGGNIGGAWARRNWSDSSFGLDFGGNDDGVFIGGGQVGFNYQVDTFVIGVEGTFDGAFNNNRTDGNVIPGSRHLVQVTSNDRWVGTLAARFGYTGWSGNHVLAYGKAGGGWVGDSGFTITDLATGASITGSSNNAAGGWLVGAGLEWAFAENWSVKIEYDFLGLTQRTFSIPVGSTVLVVGDTFATHNNDLQMAVVGLNYRFNWVGPASNPVVTKY